VPDDFFGEPVAARYDAAAAEMFDAAVVGPAVDLLAGLAGDGRALELGIGTGRIALPLAGRGVPVAGIDLSEYEKRFQIELARKYEDELDKLKAADLIEIEGERMFLTRKGKLFSNEVFSVFV